jgi:hypothetical protein
MASRPSVVWVFMISNSAVKATGFEQDAVRNADLANVVQRCRLEQHLDVTVGQAGGKRGCLRQMLGQCLDVILGAPDVVAGVRVAGFGQRGHGNDGHVLDGHHLAGALVHLDSRKSLLSRRKSACALSAR